ncbi:Protein CBG16271 [Caenorhabditis briggsae]|uniref:Protein CBG16271 n=1 Tax=Caenorhabditis briggsae TaxID=6238 RepID=A8XNS0_CAEBR|nr:Protein CBG16271 [Caenorhabditis briggsae]CAP34159.1 Protein CBG16271 [Caenorhabditis briggsae]
MAVASFEQLPDVVLREVLRDQDFISLQRIRKVHPNLTSFIEKNKNLIESNLKRLEVKEHRNFVKVKMSDLWRHVKVGYKEKEDGCVVIHKDKKQIVKNEDVLSRILEDLILVLTHQKQSLVSLSLAFSDNYPTFFENLAEYLATRRHQLQVEQLEIKIADVSRLIPLLQGLSAKHLKSIHLRSSTGERSHGRAWDLTGISDQDVWKGAKEVVVERIAVRVPVRNLLHLSTINIHMDNVTAEDIHSLRQTALYSSDFKSFKIKFNSLEDESLLLVLLGNPARTRRMPSGNIKMTWWFTLEEHSDAFTKVLEIVRKRDVFKFSNSSIAMALEDPIVVA